MELVQTRQRWQGYEQATAFYRVFLASLLDMAWGRLGLWPSSLRLRCLRRYLVAPYAYRPYVYRHYVYRPFVYRPFVYGPRVRVRVW
jgi:hypothetical protein